MKFTMHKNEIRNILARVQGLTGRKTNLAITENILIQAQDSGIRMVATDLETGFEGAYAATVESGGTIAINAKKLFEIVRDFPTEEILIDEVENRWIQIGNGKIEYHIVGMNPEDFPETPHLEDVPFFEIDAASFRRMIEKTVIIAGTGDDRRPHINGVFFEDDTESGSRRVKMVTTDGSRLSVVEYPYDESELPFEAGVLIPKKGLQEVLKFLGPEGTVKIGIKESHFVVKREEETITIRLLEGEFPRYQDILVRDASHRITLNRQQFLMMLKRMSILSSENYKGVIFNFGDNTFLVRATNPDLGESREEMAIPFEEETIEAAFNPRYFIETLGVIEDENVVLNIINGERPCMVEGENDTSYLSVIMPMKI